LSYTHWLEASITPGENGPSVCFCTQLQLCMLSRDDTDQVVCGLDAAVTLPRARKSLLRVRDLTGASAIERVIADAEQDVRRLKPIASQWSSSEQAVLDPSQPPFAGSDFAFATLLQYAALISLARPDSAPTGLCVFAVACWISSLQPECDVIG
jgi:hypothetical protein